MLASARTHTTLPATDPDRARRFYEETVGLVPADIQPGGVFYDTAGVPASWSSRAQARHPAATPRSGSTSTILQPRSPTYGPAASSSRPTTWQPSTAKR